MTQRPALVLTGGRQTGKTSLLQRMFPDLRFVTLDLPSQAALAENDPEEFLRRFEQPLIVDEIQYAPALFRHIKVAIDQQRDRTGQFLLTGSQKFTLMKAVGDSLAGRVDILELETLSLAELRGSGVDAALERIVHRGGFPELWQKPDLPASRFYGAFVASYLERDVKSLLNVGQLRDFERFVRACALRSAQLLNKADLARDVGISPSTANSWLSVLAASGQVVLLEPWFSNKTKALSKTPKLYLADTGLLCFLLNIETVDQMLRSPHIGAIWETYVFAELRKLQQRQTGQWRLWFWRDRSREVDFLLDRGGVLHLADAKWRGTPVPKDSAAMAYAATRTKENVVRSQSIICRTPQPYRRNDGVLVSDIESLVVANKGPWHSGGGA